MRFEVVLAAWGMSELVSAWTSVYLNCLMRLPHKAFQILLEELQNSFVSAVVFNALSAHCTCAFVYWPVVKPLVFPLSRKTIFPCMKIVHLTEKQCSPMHQIAGWWHENPVLFGLLQFLHFFSVFENICTRACIYDGFLFKVFRYVN